MTTKLTLNIDSDVIYFAKKYAKLNKRSVSDIVESYLKSLTSKSKLDKEISPKVLKLMGVIKLPKNFNYKAEIGNVLFKKVMTTEEVVSLLENKK
jgi:hypothetical protein